MSRLGLCIGIKLPPVSTGRSLGIAAAFCSVVMVASIGGARAADWPLRGSIVPAGYTRWDGWQFGVEAGLANMRSDFGNSTSSQVAFILRNSLLEAEGAPSTWTTLAPRTTNGEVLGLFLGYNMQWDQLVVGFDLAYKYASSLNAESSDSLTRRFPTSDNIQHDVTIDARTSLKLVDYATLRGRAGYAVGNFLPYAVVGIAAGRFNYLTSVTVTDVMTNLPSPPAILGDAGTFSQSASTGKTNAIVGGIAGGLGLDWAMTPGMFLRAEWEYIAFAQVNGSRPNINTGKVGVGMRF